MSKQVQKEKVIEGKHKLCQHNEVNGAQGFFNIRTQTYLKCYVDVRL